MHQIALPMLISLTCIVVFVVTSPDILNLLYFWALLHYSILKKKYTQYFFKHQTQNMKFKQLEGLMAIIKDQS